jgi:hypothetical protein
LRRKLTQQYLEREKHYGAVNHRVEFTVWKDHWAAKCVAQASAGGGVDGAGAILEGAGAAVKEMLPARAPPTAEEMDAAVDILKRSTVSVLYIPLHIPRIVLTI